MATEDGIPLVETAQAYSTPLTPGVVTLMIDGVAFNLSMDEAASLLHQIGNALSNARAWSR